ncbi:unnamed protein product, partial [Mesorhabditis belari]|uniref:G-protein coupled receptors family 1 profile domain-containing protein n=1 Tax=Mesorhabditis belari TaxID=2138241 RepID=A0AAF3E8C6_9BILA
MNVTSRGVLNNGSFEDSFFLLHTAPTLSPVIQPNEDNDHSACHFNHSSQNYFIVTNFIMIFLLSVTGNALVIVVISTQRAMRSITNIYLMNLAVSDLMLSVLCMPPTLVSTVMNCWMFGALMCKLLAYLQPVVVTASAYTLAVIAIERYYAICRPLHSRIWQTRSHAYFMISIVWLISILANGLAIFMYQQGPYVNYNELGVEVYGLTCAPIFPPWVHFIYQVYMTMVLLLVPLILMTVLYGQVIRSLRVGIRMDIAATEGSFADNDTSVDDDGSRKPSLVGKMANKVDNNNSNNNNNKTKAQYGSGTVRAPMTAQSVRSTHTQKSAAAKRRVVKMLIVIVIIFFCCWTPTYVWWLIVQGGDVFTDGIQLWNPLVNTVITTLCYLSSCTNPITYCFLNKKFRTAMRTIFGRKKLIRQHFQKVYMPTDNGAFYPQNGKMHRSMSSNFNPVPGLLDKPPIKRCNSNVDSIFETVEATSRVVIKDLCLSGRETHC